MKLKKERWKHYLKNREGIYTLSRFLYTVFIHPERLLKRKSYGSKNSERTILLIRPVSEDGIQGLMSLFVQAARWIQYAKEHNYVCFVDYKTYKTQYYDGVNNAWDFFFQQPDDLSYEEVYNSKEVILSGITLKKTTDDTLFREHVFKDKDILKKSHAIIHNYISITNEVQSLIEKENRILHVEECVGVYIRGTDYAKLRTGRRIQTATDSRCCQKGKGVPGYSSGD